MKSEKKYFSIREVSKMLGIKEHVIRHWDSIDPKTKKFRIPNLSIRTKGGMRFFNKSHIKKLSSLQSILKENGKRNYSLDLANKIIFQEKKQKKPLNFLDKNIEEKDKIKVIINDLKTLINYK